MKIIADFFVDSLVVPAYFYFAAYGIVWLLTFLLARLFMDPDQSQVERAARRAWRFGFVVHIIGGTALIAWIIIRAIPRVAEWWHVPFYLIFYVLFVIVDVCFLISLSTNRTTKPTPAVSSRPQHQSSNPKKR